VNSPRTLPMFAMLASAVLATLVACSRTGDGSEIHGTLERDRLELVAESHERIVEILVHEGDHVVAGAPLVRQEAGTMQPRLEQARATVTEAERKLAELVQGPRAREIDEARAALAGAQGTFEADRREYERVRTLVERRLVSDSNLDQARARQDASASSRDQAQARLKLLLEGTRSEQVQQAQAAADRARSALAELETTASRYLTRAPRGGFVEALPYKLGERPPAGAPVVVLLADGTPYARVYVPEPLRVRFTAGAKVTLAVDGIASPLQGVVRYVSAEATYTPYYTLTQEDRSRLAFLAEISVPDPAAEKLPAGVPVQVRVPDGT
jgi:HlyD family secretion protein